MNISRGIIIYKFILGWVELLLGLGILFFGKNIYNVYANFRNNELLEDPHDLLAMAIDKILPFILMHRGRLALILIALGLVKVVGAIGFFYKKHWGFDLLVGFTFMMLPFELYTLLAKFSILKLSYLAVNLFIALYLVEFKPKDYFTSVKKRMGK